MLPSCSHLPVATGIGLRAAHHERVSAERPRIAWLEVHTENFLGGGATPALLESLRGQYAISLHGVGLSLGSADGLDEDHLSRIAALVRRIDPAAISDHVSWSMTGGVYFNDLLPVPYDEEALEVIARNVMRFQDAIGRAVMVENPSTYLRHAQSDRAEPQFLAELCQRSGCGLLLDVNNVFVSSENHGDDARAYLAAIAHLPIGEIHLSGHHLRTISNRAIRIDDHGSPVADQVWALYEHALELIGPRPTLIEWDSSLPDLETLLAEADKAGPHLERARRSAA
ncbi:MAG: MNIO family bufferin maturase [Dongiaceae bacterium]